MFTLILTIRQAECALSDGRLDEAYELARRDEVRSHRRGQRLVTRLVRALATRGQAHLGAGRAPEAAADAEKAAALGGNVPEVADLKAKTAEALAHAADAAFARQREQRNKARTLEAARQRIDEGELTVGKHLLSAVAAADDQSRAQWLLKDVEAREATIESAAAAAGAALKRDDWEAALDAVARVRPADLHDGAIADVAARVSHRVADAARDALEEGQLHLAQAMLDRLASTGLQNVEAQSLRQALALCRRAWRFIDGGQTRQAEETLRRVVALLPKAAWTTPALRQMKAAAEATEELRSGPLGLLAAGTDTVALHPRAVSPALSPSPGTPGEGRVEGERKAAPVIPVAFPGNGHFASPGDDLPSRFVLQVDGAGSYFVLTHPLVTIGPVSSPAAPDLGLMAEAGAAVAKIERSEDDYFVRAQTGAVAVNGQLCNGASRLLKDGDDVALSPRCRFRFRRPNAASTSAVLDLTGGRLPRGDVRRVILLDRELIVGPGPLTHVRVDELPEPLILQVRQGRLLCRTKEPVLVAGKQADPRAALPVGSHVRIGPVSFVVTKA